MYKLTTRGAFSTVCHVQVMSVNIQMSARSGTRLPVALLHVTDLHSWPSSVTFSWRKQTAGTTVLHGQLWTAFLRFFWSDCQEWYAGLSAQPGLISKWLKTMLKTVFCSRLFRCSFRMCAFVTVNLLIERFEMSVYYYYYYTSIKAQQCPLITFKWTPDKTYPMLWGISRPSPNWQSCWV